MKKGGEKDIVGDSETNAAAFDNSILEEPDGDKVDEVPFKDGDFEVPPENILKKQRGSTSHAIDIDECGISSTENGLTHREAEIEEVEVKTKIGEDYSLDRGVISEIREMNSNTDDFIEREKQGVPWILEIESNTDCKVEVEQQPKIQEVPTTFRENESAIESNNCFDPKVIAIGPIHRDKPKLQRMEKFKVKFASKYAARSKKSMRTLYYAVEKEAMDARSCYALGSKNNISSNEFAKMMFLDGCFVLQFIYYYLKSSMEDVERDVNMKAIDMMFVFHDIMLLENQLPLKFLKALMWFQTEEQKNIDNFISLIVRKEGPREENARCWKSCWNCKSDPDPKGDEPVKEGPVEGPVHLLDLVRTKFVNGDEIKKGTSWSRFSRGRSYRSVTELKSAGINFKCSSSRRFSDITFKSGWFKSGCLRLPRITIDENTKPLLLNLVAWEACLRNPDFAVSSYVYLMDTLIDNAEDVKKLKYNGVMVNELGSDEPVAELFNKITRNLAWDPLVFGKVKNSISEYCNSRHRFWWAEWVHPHFRSPWATIALIAAILALGLTLAQTVFSAIQL